MTANEAAQFFAQVEQVHHDWRYDNPKILYGLIRSLKPAVVVEVGTYKGYAASWMAQALKENGAGHLYCIDNFTLLDHESRVGPAREHLNHNLTILGVRDHVTLLDGDSDKVTWPDKVDFAYVDGWHGYKMTKHDFDKCATLGAECICLDDTTQTIGPRMLMDEVRACGEWDMMDVQRDCGMTICMKRRPKGAITFSQELPMHPGVDLQTLTRDEQLEHLRVASLANHVGYGPVLNSLCDGRSE